MHHAKKRSPHLAEKAASSARNGKTDSLRELKAFGLWAGRAEVRDPVHFTKDAGTGPNRLPVSAQE
jgi:hypothetical protein